MIQINHLRKVFGTKEILKDVNLEIKRGATTVVLGMSGGGKSTIIKHIIGLLKPTSGEIIIDGVDIAKASEKALFEARKKIGYLFQSGALFDSMNVYENVEFPLLEHTNMSKKERRQKIFNYIEMVGLKPEDVISLYPDELSGGMRKRVGLARTIILDPQVILYDEPTSGLDPITSDLITQLILKLQAQFNATSVLISHDMKESLKSGDYFAMLYQGKIIYYGDKQDILNTSHQHIQQFLNGESMGPIEVIN